MKKLFVLSLFLFVGCGQDLESGLNPWPFATDQTNMIVSDVDLQISLTVNERQIMENILINNMLRIHRDFNIGLGCKE